MKENKAIDELQKESLHIQLAGVACDLCGGSQSDYFKLSIEELEKIISEKLNH